MSKMIDTKFALILEIKEKISRKENDKGSDSVKIHYNKTE